MTNPTDIESSTASVPSTSNPTLGERMSLWFGLAGDRTVKFKSWDAIEETALSRALYEGRGKMEGGRVGKKISITLSHMCTELAGAKFWEETDDGYKQVMNELEREAHIRRMWETDVLIAYFLLRIDALGDPFVKLQVPSPFDPLGKRLVIWKGDISGAEMFGSENVEDAFWDYELRRPFKIRGKIASKFCMGPLRWATADSLQFQTKPYEAKLRGILGSIQLIPDVSMSASTSYTLADLGRLHKTDIEAITAEIESRQHGMDLEIECYDPEAEQTFKTALPWIHPDFFGASSQFPD